MSAHIETSGQLLTIICYFVLGSTNAFKYSNAAVQYGLVWYALIYLLCLVLVGIPAFLVEISFLTKTSSLKTMYPQTVRNLYWASFIQYFLLCWKLGHDYSKIIVLMMLAIANLETPSLAQVTAKKCRSVEFSGGLPNPCARYKAHLVPCFLYSLLQCKRQILAFTLVSLTALGASYMRFFSLSWKSVYKVGLVILSFGLLAFCLVMNFFRGKRFSWLIHEVLITGTPSMTMVSDSMVMCLQSLSVVSFGLATLGARSSQMVRGKFLTIGIFSCFGDFLLSFAFSLSKISRRTFVKNTCNLTTTQMVESIEVESLNELIDQSNEPALKEAAKSDVLEIFATILLFSSETRSIAYLLCLVIAFLNVIILTMIMCVTMFLLPLEFFVSSNGNYKSLKKKVVIICAAQIVCLIVYEAAPLSSKYRLLDQTLNGLTLTFFLIRFFDSIVTISRKIRYGTLSLCMPHVLQGMYDMTSRRSVVRHNSVNLLLHDWYALPCMLMMRTVGYPMLFFIAMLRTGYDNVLDLSCCGLPICILGAPLLARLGDFLWNCHLKKWLQKMQQKQN